MARSQHVRGVHAPTDTTAASTVVYKALEEDQSVTMEDIWPAASLGELPPKFRRIKNELEKKSKLDQEALNLLLCCPNDQQSRLYVNGMSGELSSEIC